MNRGFTQLFMKVISRHSFTLFRHKLSTILSSNGKSINWFSEHWIESRSWIEGKVFVHLVLLDLCKRGCECIAFDLIKHNVFVCLTGPPAKCIALQSHCSCCEVSMGLHTVPSLLLYNTLAAIFKVTVIP